MGRFQACPPPAFLAQGWGQQPETQQDPPRQLVAGLAPWPCLTLLAKGRCPPHPPVVVSTFHPPRPVPQMSMSPTLGQAQICSQGGPWKINAQRPVRLLAKYLLSTYCVPGTAVLVIGGKRLWTSEPGWFSLCLFSVFNISFYSNVAHEHPSVG